MPSLWCGTGGAVTGLEELTVLLERVGSAEHDCMSWSECEHEAEIRAIAVAAAQVLYRKIAEEVLA